MWKKEEMIAFTKEQQESHEKTTICCISQEHFEHKYTSDKNYRKVKDHCHYIGKYKSAVHSICNLKCNILKKISVFFRDGLNYNYHLFSVPITKEVEKIDKNGEEVTKTIYFKLQFIDSARFMASSLLSLCDNLANEIHNIKCKHGHDNKKWETCAIKYNDCEFCLQYKNVKDDLILCKCLWFNRNYQQMFDENLRKRFANTYRFSNHDNNKFILLLGKGVYLYEYMDD